MKKVRWVILAACVIALLAAAVGGKMATTRAVTINLPPAPSFVPPVVKSVVPDPRREPQLPTIVDRTVLGTLPVGVGVARVPRDAPRPLKTNSWWSGGHSDQWPSPAFPLPFKAVFGDSGLVLSTPGRRVQDKTIFADDREPIRVFGPRAAQGAVAVAAGDWDVTFRVRDAGGPQFDATLAQGSPFVFIRPLQGSLSVALPSGAVEPVDCRADCGSAILVRGPRSQFLLVSPIADAFTTRGSVTEVRFEEGRKLLTVVAVAPDSSPRDYLAAAMRPYTGTTASYTLTSSQVFTTFRFPEQTVMGLLPHHFTSLPYVPSPQAPSPIIDGSVAKLIGTFETVRGPIRLYAGRGFRTVLQRPSIMPSLPPLQSLRGDAALKAQLGREVAENKAPAGDIYFAGKDMLRIAMLAELADLLGDEELKARALGNARKHLAGFCTANDGDPFSIAYDPTAGGIIAFPVGFGSEHYNDHHFHYGYLLHSAAIIGRFDPTFLAEYDGCFRLLARDIASPLRNDSSFPYLRYFDPYGGHSWAGGLTNFADGNNQESASEAMHAWYGLALYGRTSGQRNLEALGTWMFAHEAHAARVYWLNAVPESGAFPANFPYPMISILWGGKADYATWFDGSDGAIRGIQFFPVTTALLPILDRETVKRIAAPTADASPKTIWKSGLTMVEAPFDPGAYVPHDWPIDPGLSRTYVDYWTRAFHELGEPLAPTGGCAGYVFRNGRRLTAAVLRLPGETDTCTFSIGTRQVTLTSLWEGWNLRGL